MVTWQWITGIALFAVIMLVIRERGYKMGPASWFVGLALLISSLATDPVNGTFFYGQINILLMFLSPSTCCRVSCACLASASALPPA